MAKFIGSPSMNILPATVAKAGGETVVDIAGSGVSVPVATPASAQGAAVCFGVRPEDLYLAKGDKALFSGRIDYIEQLGEVQLLYVDIGRKDEPLVAKLPGNAAVKRGETVRLDADAGDLHIFDAEGHNFARGQAVAE